MKRLLSILAVTLVVTFLFSGCTTINKSMKEPNVLVELAKEDFTLSDQVSAEASSTQIFNIDFSRLFLQKTGNIQSGSVGISLASIPVIGSMMSNKTANYALYELMQNNPGYDVVFYPQYETKIVKPVLGIGFIMKTTTVKTTARLGKLK